MNLRSCRFAAWAVIGLLVLVHGLAWAADDPPADGKKAAKKPAAAPPAKPAAPTKSAAPAKTGKAEAKPAEAVPAVPALPDPAVEAILEAKPTTPAELFRAATLLVRLKRPDLAKKSLAQLLAAKPDDEAWGKLVDQFGTGEFIALTGKPELNPEAIQVRQTMQAASARRLADPKRLETLIGQLSDPKAEVREQAQRGVLASGQAAVPPLLSALADPQRAAQHPPIRAVLAALKSAAREPLAAALDAPDAALAAQVVAVLAAMDARQAVPYLLAPALSAKSDPALKHAAQAALSDLLGSVPSASRAAEMLAAQASVYFQGQQPLAGAVDGQVELWHWDAVARRPVPETVSVADAARQVAFRFAREAYRIASGEPSLRRLYLATLLEEEAYRLGRDKLPAAATPGETEAAAFDVAVLEDALLYTLKQGHPAAATALVRVLGRSGKVEQVLYHGGAIPPLVQAARHADRRLQMAALAAAVDLKPREPYAGSSFVVEGLSFLAASRGSPRVLAASPRSDEAMQMAAGFIGQGFEIDLAGNGREAVVKAISSPDYEFAYIDAGIDRPSVDFVMQELRRDCRAADLPVAIAARDEHLARAEHVAHNHRLTLAVARPHDAEAQRWQKTQLQELAGLDFVPYAVRRQQALASLELLAKLLAGPVKAYDVRRLQTPLLTALAAPAFALQAAPLVGQLGTPDSQTALVELASQPVQPFDVRRAAAMAFSASVKKSGVLLTSRQILRQYDRYNQSERLDRNTQAVLGHLLNSLERPAAARKLDALRAEKPVEKKPADAAPTDAKPAEKKPGDAKPAAPAAAKPVAPKPEAAAPASVKKADR